MGCFNPSTGEVIALAPECTAEEVESPIMAAQVAYPTRADTPVSKRVQVLYKMKANERAGEQTPGRAGLSAMQ